MDRRRRGSAATAGQERVIGVDPSVGLTTNGAFDQGLWRRGRRRRDQWLRLMRHVSAPTALTAGTLTTAMAELTRFRALIAAPSSPHLLLAAAPSACHPTIALAAVATDADCEHGAAGLLTAVAHSKPFHATMYWFPFHFIHDTSNSRRLTDDSRLRRG